MKALVKYEKGIGKMEVREVPIPKPKYEEVLIKVEACGICGTDLKILEDQFSYYPPVIMGHEFSGRIVALGEGVKYWKEGDRVVSEQHTGACGKCRYCLTGKRHFCSEKRSPGYGVDGAFAEYISIPCSLLHKIPDEIDFIAASLIEPMAVAFYGILERTGIKPEDTVVILGCGPIALLALQIVRAEGASKVILTGLEADMKRRFAIAEQYGACRMINIQKEDPVPLVFKETNGYGADVVIDLTGSSSGILQGLDLLRKDGKFCAIGLPHGEVPFPWTSAATKAIHIHFSYSSDYESWRRCISLIKHGKVKLDEFTKDIYPLEDWEKAFIRAKSGESLKVIIRP